METTRTRAESVLERKHTLTRLTCRQVAADAEQNGRPEPSNIRRPRRDHKRTEIGLLERGYRLTHTTAVTYGK